MCPSSTDYVEDRGTASRVTSSFRVSAGSLGPWSVRGDTCRLARGVLCSASDGAGRTVRGRNYLTLGLWGCGVEGCEAGSGLYRVLGFVGVSVVIGLGRFLHLGVSGARTRRRHTSLLHHR